MQEISIDSFRGLDSFKIKRFHLVASLIIIELVGILTLAWYLRVPLYQKYLTVSTRTYSLSALSTNQKYLFTQGDFIVGKTAPSNQVVALIRNEGDLSKKLKFRIPVSQDGTWDFRIPSDTEPGSYRVTIGIFASNNSSISIDTYKVRLLSGNIFSNDRSLKEFLANFTDNTSVPAPSSSADPEDIEEINQSLGNTGVPLEESSDEPSQTPAKPILVN